MCYNEVTSKTKEKVAAAHKMKLLAAAFAAAVLAVVLGAFLCFEPVWRNFTHPVGTPRLTLQMGTVNLNLADRDELCTLPGIGEKRAEDIVAYRNQNGPFSTVQELARVEGISEKLLEKLDGLVCVK